MRERETEREREERERYLVKIKQIGPTLYHVMVIVLILHYDNMQV